MTSHEPAAGHHLMTSHGTRHVTCDVKGRPVMIGAEWRLYRTRVLSRERPTSPETTAGHLRTQTLTWVAGRSTDDVIRSADVIWGAGGKADWPIVIGRVLSDVDRHSATGTH